MARQGKMDRRWVGIGIAFILALALCPVMAFAESGPDGAGGDVASSAQVQTELRAAVAENGDSTQLTTMSTHPGLGYRATTLFSMKADTPTTIMVVNNSSGSTINLNTSLTGNAIELPRGCGYCSGAEEGCGIPGVCPNNWGYCDCTGDYISRSAWYVLKSEGNSSIATVSLTEAGALSVTPVSVGTTTISVAARLDAPGSDSFGGFDSTQPGAYGRETSAVNITIKVVEPVEVDSYDLSSYREASYGTPPNGTATADGQHVKAVLHFGDAVSITDAAALANSLNITLARGSDVVPTFMASGNDLIIDMPMTMLPGGVITLAAADTANHLLEGVEVGGNPIQLETIKSIIPTGLEFELVGATPGTSSTPASSTFRVTKSADVRSMNHIIWLTNGGSIITDTSGDFSQSTVAHHHTFWSFTTADSAASIVSNAMSETSSATNLVGSGYVATDNGDGTFTITANTAVVGEVLTAANYDDLFFKANGVSIGEAILAQKVPTPGIPAVDENTLSADGKSRISIPLSNLDEMWIAGDKTVLLNGSEIPSSQYAFTFSPAALSLQSVDLGNGSVQSTGGTGTLAIDVAAFDLGVAASKTVNVQVRSYGAATLSQDMTITQTVASVTNPSSGTLAGGTPKTGDTIGMTIALVASLVLAACAAIVGSLALRRRFTFGARHLR